MTQLQITGLFLLVISVIATAMVIHAIIDKRRIKKDLHLLLASLKGEIVQENLFVYPRFHGTLSGRELDIFFTVVKVGRQHILYYIVSLTAKITDDLLLLKKACYKPVANDFSETAGGLLPEIHPDYEAHSKQPGGANRLLKAVPLSLPALEEFSSLQLGPDAIVAGKPYDERIDTDAHHILKNVQALATLALTLEQSPVS